MHRYMITCLAVLMFAGVCGKQIHAAEQVQGETGQAKDGTQASKAGDNPMAEAKAAKPATGTRKWQPGGWWSSALDPETASHRRAIPYVPSRHDSVGNLLWLAEVGPNDVVYDLGSGDGRVVIAAVRDFGAKKAVGIEIKPELVEQSRANAAKTGVADKVEFIQGDLFTTDFSQASVVVLYLSHAANVELRARLVRTLKPGSRVVSHQFGMGEWPAEKVLDIRTVYQGMWGVMENRFEDNPYVPAFGAIGKGPTHDVVSVWIVPAPVAGVWRGKIPLESGEAELTLTLHQNLAKVSGSFQLAGSTNVSGNVSTDLCGDRLRCWCIPTGRDSHASEMWFDGRASGDTLEGSLWGGNMRVVKWTGQRSKTDIAETWEWAGPKGSPVQLKIERREGQLAATYTDPNRRLPKYEDPSRPIPITDIYDFGGGFYFTLLLGSEGGGIRVSPDSGWLTGEAVADGDALNGTIRFFPYEQNGVEAVIDTKSPQMAAYSAMLKASREWHAKRIK